MVRVVAHALFGPLDLTIRAAQELPAAVDKARQQLVLARFVGKLAVAQGVVEIRRLLDDQGRPNGGPATRRTPAAADTSDAAGGGASGEAPSGDAVAGVALDPDAAEIPDAAELALPDYAQLPAAHIVAKLAGLRQSERDAIEAFEASHRHRRTVLGKLEQLRES